MSADPEVLPKSDFRQGRRVARNVYHGDEPLFMAATDELAAELVLILNAGAATLRAPQNGGAAAMREAAISETIRHQTLALNLKAQAGEKTEGWYRWDLVTVVLRDLAAAFRTLPLAQPDPSQEPGTGGER